MFQTGYYRVTNSAEAENRLSEKFVDGDLVYVYAGQEKLEVLVNGSKWLFDYDKPSDIQQFADNFAFEPEGSKIRQAEIATLMDEISNVDATTEGMQKQLTHFNPCVSDSGEMTETGTELAPVTDMYAVKKMVATNRNTLVKIQKGIKEKTNQLKTLMEEQTTILALKTKELTALLEKAEEAIWSINLYMGKNEEIHVLRTGVPAPADQKIVLRQQVLYMDEECAIAARSEGIDIHSVEQFDQWLLESPAHLNRVLYEDKAIVALHVKRYKKSYGDDPWANTEINKANLHWTYFLVRNGENLYRVFIDLDAGQYMFPTTDSLTSLFHDTKPGSKEYMAAIKTAEESHRHYLRVLLVLQGLLDRTPIFKPMPVERINLCDPAQSYDYVEFIYDAEKQLTDGRPPFDDWLSEVNDQLEVGHRIMGIFDYRSGITGSRENCEDSRISPKNADRPKSNILHTIDREEDGHFVFKYARKGEKVYTRYGSHEPKNRASCWVEKGDNFFLNFDAVELTDLEYYAVHRLSRHLYRDMITLLEESIKLKKKETADEEPFRQLLVGQMMKQFSVTREKAEEVVPTLIRWWKFKNREHRALLSDDKLALEMIVKEFGLRLRNATADQGMHEAVLAMVMPSEPLMVARKRDNVYVVYVPHNHENIWVREQEWKFYRSNGTIVMTEESEWQTVDKRHWRWDVLYRSDRWKDWRINPFKNKVLTDPEIEEVQATAREQLEKNYKKEVEAGDFLFLTVTCDSDFEVKVWFSDQRLKVPALLHSESISDPNVRCFKPNWEKKAGKVTVGRYYGYGSTSTYTFTDVHMPWEGKTSRVLWEWPDNIDQVAAEWRGEKAADAKQREIRKRYDYASRILTDQIYQNKVAAAQHEFLSEHGDPELWEDHLKELKIPRYVFSILDEALRLYSERDLSPVGQTVAAVIAQARQWGMGQEKKGYRGYHDPDYATIPQHLDMTWVIPADSKLEEEED